MLTGLGPSRERLSKHTLDERRLSAKGGEDVCGVGEQVYQLLQCINTNPGPENRTCYRTDGCY
jgi:hypothetical protein